MKIELHPLECRFLLKLVKTEFWRRHERDRRGIMSIIHRLEEGAHK